MKGFRNFLMRGNLIDLAVAVVIGVAFNAVVQALVADIVTPLITAAGGGKTTFANLYFTIGAKSNVFYYGKVLNALLSFLVIAAVVYYLLVAPSARLTALADRHKAATDRECPECLSKIPVGAKRCMYCTAEVQPFQPSDPVPPPRRSRHGYLAAE